MNRKIWKCPKCGVEHLDFKIDQCRNQKCSEYFERKAHWKEAKVTTNTEPPKQKELF